MASAPTRSGFIVVGSERIGRRLAALLESHGLRPVTDLTTAPYRDPRQILAAIRESTLFIAVDDGRGRGADIYAEIGAAMAAERPILIVAKKHPYEEEPRPILAALPVVVLPTMREDDVLAVAREFVARYATLRSTARPEAAAGLLPADQARRLLERLDEVRDLTVRSDLVRATIIADALRATGAVVAVEPANASVDIVALPSSDPSGAIAIETKLWLWPDSRRAHRELKRLKEASERIGARGALLVWASSAGPLKGMPSGAIGGGLGCYEMKAFLRALRDTDLAGLCGFADG